MVVLSRNKKRDQVYNDIRLPRPGAGNLVYPVAKAIGAVKNLVKSNSIHLPRLFLAMVKEKMINEKRIPVKRCQFNCILKAADDGATTPICWNTRGRPNIISPEELKSQFDENAKRDRKGWDVSNTREAIFNAIKKKRESDGLDASTMGPPDKKLFRLTMQRLHLYLVSRHASASQRLLPARQQRHQYKACYRLSAFFSIQ